MSRSPLGPWEHKGIKSDHYLKLVGEAAKRLRENLKDKH